MNTSEISMPVAKAGTAIAAAVTANTELPEDVARLLVKGATDSTLHIVMNIPWGTVASIAAATYTFLLIGEWWWKKLWRPAFEAFGWIKPRKRYVLTEAEWDEVKDEE